MNLPVDWKAFEYKFSADPRAAFESLAYILFCYELKQDCGIFRYYNQPYIETQPVDTADGHKVGFQAKYYDAGTTVASREQELKAAIEGVKKKYAGIDRLIFYVNKEFSASSAKDKDKPQYQLNIEKCGSDRGIEIQWRVQSHVEKMLAQEELKYIKNLYFNPDAGIDRFHEKLMNHKNSILKHIHSSIKYGDEEVKIHQDYQKLLDFQKSNTQVMIIHGAAGAGKSATVKDFLLKKDKNKKDEKIVLFSASDLDVKEENLFLQDGNYGLQDLFGLYKNEKYKLCILDSAEKYSTARYPEVFGDILHQFLDHGWKVLITIRTFYKESFCNIFLKNYTFCELEILKLKKETLTEIGMQYSFVLPTDAKVQDVLCNLFYLNLYLNLDCTSKDEHMNVDLFRDAIWKQVIRNDFQQYNNLPVKREAFLQRMICDMLANERYTYPMKDTDDFETISALENSGIIIPYKEDRFDWMMSHDVYEEIVTNHIFTKRLEQDEYLKKTFFSDFGKSFRSRKVYRIWLESCLADNNDKIQEFLLDILEDETLEPEWRDETLIALMNSESEESRFTLDVLLSQSEQGIFFRMMRLLNTACRSVIDSQILKLISEQKKAEVNPYRYARPRGTAWKTLLKYTYENRDRINWSEENQSVVTEALDTWTQAESEGETTRAAGLIALYLRKKIYAETKYKYELKENDTYKKLNEIILKAAKEIKTELEELFSEIFRTNALDHRSEYYLLIEKAISNVMECGMLHAAIPETLIKLLEKCWMEPGKKIDQGMGFHTKLDTDFGLKEHLGFRYYPISALQTPVYNLLCAEAYQSMKFVLNLLNYACECYQNSFLAKEYNECQEIELIFSESEKVKQICSARLWQMHRGTVSTPNVLECVLMALERWLLELAEISSEKLLKKICLFLLKESNNVAITATILSVVEAYPEKLFEISCILLRTKEIFHYDIQRLTAETGANFLKGYLPKGEVFHRERISSNNLKFRKVNFEQVIMNYQIKKGEVTEKEFNRRVTVLYDVIDQTTKDMETWDPIYQYAYYRMDLRSYTKDPEIVETEGKKYLGLKLQVPDELVELSENTEQNRKEFYQSQHVELNVWSYARYKRDIKTSRKYKKYEKHPETAYEEMKGILENKNKREELQGISVAIYTCATLLRDFREQLSEETVTYCEAIIPVIVRQWLQADNCYALNGAIDAVIPELVKLVSCKDLSADWNNPMFLLIGILIKQSCDWEILSFCIADILWKQDEYAALKVLYTYTQLYPIYQKKDWNCGEKSCLATFLDTNKTFIEENFREEIEDINKIDMDSLDFRCILSFYTLLNKKDEGNFLFVINTGKKIWGKIFDKEDIEENRAFFAEDRYAYTRWLADYVLDLPSDKQKKLIQNIMPCVSMEDTFVHWIWEIVACEMEKSRDIAFWNVWDLLQPYIFRRCDEQRVLEESTDTKYFKSTQEFEELIKNYLLAGIPWAEKMTFWDSLKPEKANFYRKAAIRIGYHPVVLYSISYILNSIGKDTFSKEGVEWLSMIMKNNPHLKKAELPVNTQYFIEEYMNTRIKKEKFTLRTNEHRRKQVMIILDFLVERGSTVGFGMREEVI